MKVNLKKIIYTSFMVFSCLTTGSLFAKTAGEKLDHAIDKTKENLDNAKDTVKDKTKEAAKATKDKAKEVSKAAKDKIKK